jgi:hypothetical protein
LIGGAWSEIIMRAQAFSTSSRAVSIDRMLAQRRAATVVQKQLPRIQEGPTDIQSKVAFFQGEPAKPPAPSAPAETASQGEQSKDKKKGLFAGLFRGRSNSKGRK